MQISAVYYATSKGCLHFACLLVDKYGALIQDALGTHAYYDVAINCTAGSLRTMTYTTFIHVFRPC